MPFDLVVIVYFLPCTVDNDIWNLGLIESDPQTEVTSLDCTQVINPWATFHQRTPFLGFGQGFWSHSVWSLITRQALHCVFSKTWSDIGKYQGSTSICQNDWTFCRSDSDCKETGEMSSQHFLVISPVCKSHDCMCVAAWENQYYGSNLRYWAIYINWKLMN
jgi:hypothetical protein